MNMEKLSKDFNNDTDFYCDEDRNPEYHKSWCKFVNECMGSKTFDDTIKYMEVNFGVTYYSANLFRFPSKEKKIEFLFKLLI